MPRKKEIRTGEHIVFMTAEAIEAIEKIVYSDDEYKDKQVWTMKYMLAFSSLIERTREADKEFVPVSIRVQRRILKVSDQECCKIYKNMVSAGIAKQSRKNYVPGESSYEYKPVITEVIKLSIERQYVDKKTDEMIKSETMRNEQQFTETEKKYLEVIRRVGMDSKIQDVMDREIEEDRKVKGYKVDSTVSSNFVPKFKTKGLRVATSYLLPEMISAVRIMEGQVRLYRPDKSSRIYTSFTNLAKKYRPYLRLNNLPLIGLDIANSQPLLAAVIFRKYSMKKYGVIKDDVLDYQHLCESGKFYDRFMEMNNVEESDRGEFKKKFFGKVFFTKEVVKENELKTQFKEMFPTCYEAIFDIKGGKYYSNEYKDFAIGMQRIEAEIIVSVNMKLIDIGVDAINIFDAIYVTSDLDYELAKELVEKAFAKHGIKPKFKKEDYREPGERYVEVVAKDVQPVEYFMYHYGEELAQELYDGQFVG